MLKGLLSQLKSKNKETKSRTRRMSNREEERMTRRHKSRNMRLSLSPFSVVTGFVDQTSGSPSSPGSNFVQTMLSNAKIQNMLSRYDGSNVVEVWNTVQEYKKERKITKRKDLAQFVYENHQFKNYEGDHALWNKIAIGMYEDNMLDDIEVEVEAKLSVMLNQCLSSEEFEKIFMESNEE